jgi:hypothetical protein
MRIVLMRIGLDCVGLRRVAQDPEARLGFSERGVAAVVLDLRILRGAGVMTSGASAEFVVVDLGRDGVKIARVG